MKLASAVRDQLSACLLSAVVPGADMIEGTHVPIQPVEFRPETYFLVN